MTSSASNPNISSLLAEIDRLRAALQAIRDTPRKDGVLTCQRLAADALAGTVPIQPGEASLGNPDYFREVIAYLHWRWEGRCAYCRNEGAEQIDHVLPVSKGGGDAIVNLVLACVACNTSKGVQTAEEFGFPDMPINACSQSLSNWRKAAEYKRREHDLLRRMFPNKTDESPF